MLMILFGLHMEVNSTISFQTCLNTCLQNRIMTVTDNYETMMALFSLDWWLTAQEDFECRPRGHFVPVESFCCFLFQLFLQSIISLFSLKCFYDFCIGNQDVHHLGRPWACKRRKKLPGQFIPCVNSCDQFYQK